MVMLHLFSKTKIPVGVAHMNFQLRGDESEADMKLVKDTCALYQLPFHVRSVDTKNYATDHGLSIQMAARELRYQWFEELMRNEGYTHLVTAHHLDDSLETTLFHLVKGGGISGIRGIPEKAERVIRPLLRSSRAEIESYAKKHQITWREDQSNAEDHYARNYIRHHVIPGLTELNPSLTDTYRITKRRLEGARQALMLEVERRREAFTRTEGDIIYIDRSAFKDLNFAIAEELLKEYGCTASQLQNLLDGIQQGAHPVRLEGDGFELVLDRDALIITPSSKDIPTVILDTSGGEWKVPFGRIKIYKTSDSRILKDQFGVTIDSERLGDTLILRPWRTGDRIQPLGMKGKKKVSDLMIDEKIPLNLKNRVLVLESDGELVWVVGLRISEKFKVRPETSERLNIVFEYDQSV